MTRLGLLRQSHAEYSLYFSGSEYVSLTSSSVLRPERTDEFSFCGWFRVPTDKNFTFFSNQDDGRGVGLGGQGIHILLNSGSPTVRLWGTSSQEITVHTVQNTFDDNIWHFLSVTYDGSSSASGVSIYVDGSNQTLATHANGLSGSTKNTAPLEIRSAFGSDATFASTTQCAVYDKELTSGEVTTIYNSGTPPDLASVGPTGNLVAYWSFKDQDPRLYPGVVDTGPNKLHLKARFLTDTMIQEDSPYVDSQFV